MPPKKQKLTGEIRNMYDFVDEDLLPKTYNPNLNIHNLKLPLRIVVSSPTGSGKSSLVCNLIDLFCDGEGTFETIRIVTADKDEALYNQLVRKSRGAVQITEGLKTLPKLETFDKTMQHLVIIDDCVLEKNLKPVAEYYIRCRKMNVSVIFLSQSFYEIPKIVRCNSSYAFLLQVGNKNDMRLTLSEFAMNIDADVLAQMYHYATSVEFSPLIIEIGCRDRNKKFRRGFIEFLKPADFVPGGSKYNLLEDQPEEEIKPQKRVRKLKVKQEEDYDDY